MIPHIWRYDGIYRDRKQNGGKGNRVSIIMRIEFWLGKMKSSGDGRW